MKKGVLRDKGSGHGCSEENSTSPGGLDVNGG